MIRGTGQFVRHRLAAHLKMELDVLEGERRLGSQRPEDLKVIIGERPPTASHRDHAVRALARPDVTAATLSAAVWASPIPPFDSAARSASRTTSSRPASNPVRPVSASGLSSVLGRPSAPPLPCTASTAGFSASSSSARRSRLDVEGLADPADRLPEPHPLPGQLIEPARELARHAIELRAQRSEAVVALDPDRRGEVATPEPSRSLKEAAQAPLERARSEHREAEREHVEGNNQNYGDGATAAERASDRGQRGQDGDGHRRAAKAGERLADGAVALAADLAFPLAGSEETFGDATVEARILVPSRATTATPGEDSSHAYCAAVASETVTVIEQLATGSLTMTEPGAVAVRFPT